MRLAWWGGYISYCSQQAKFTHLCFSFQTMEGFHMLKKCIYAIE